MGSRTLQPRGHAWQGAMRIFRQLYLSCASFCINLRITVHWQEACQSCKALICLDCFDWRRHGPWDSVHACVDCDARFCRHGRDCRCLRRCASFNSAWAVAHLTANRRMVHVCNRKRSERFRTATFASHQVIAPVEHDASRLPPGGSDVRICMAFLTAPAQREAITATIRLRLEMMR
jgi:hypothetical protein